MSKIIYEEREFTLEFQEYHPPLWLSFWTGDDFLKEYKNLCGSDAGFIYLVKGGEFTGFMETAGEKRLYSDFGSKISRPWMDKEVAKFSKKLSSFRKMVLREEKKEQSRESLREFFIELRKSLGWFNPHSNVFYLVSKVLEEEILKKLEKHGYENAQSILVLNSSATKETFSMSYAKKLDKIAGLIKKEGLKFNSAGEIDKNSAVKNYADELEKEFFCLCSLNSGKRTGQSFVADIFSKLNEAPRTEEKIKIPKEVAKEISLIRGMAYFKDECSTFLPTFVKYAPEKIWDKTAEYLGVSKDDLDYLLIDEIIDLLKDPGNVDNFISQRKKMALFVHHPNVRTFVTEGIHAEDLAKPIFDQMSSADAKAVDELTGKIGAKGKATGTVHKILSSSELKDFKDGEVLVTVYTGPDFVPAMKKAKAIVTDTGGITCHAAIVSRELSKPCVVGTKIATKVLKDGDLVEVDADKGIVKVLKRK